MENFLLSSFRELRIFLYNILYLKKIFLKFIIVEMLRNGFLELFGDLMFEGVGVVKFVIIY